MATSLVPGQILKLSFWSVDQEQAAVNVLHYKVDTVGFPAMTDQDVADTISPIYGASIITTMAATVDYRGCQCQVIWPLPVKVSADSTIGQASGTGGGVSLPRQATGITSWYTANAGKGFRGRTYWPFPASTQDSADGVPNGGYRSAIDTLSNNLLLVNAIAVAGRTGNVHMIIYHRALHTDTPIILKFARGVWATQKRRGSYGRANKTPV